MSSCLSWLPNSELKGFNLPKVVYEDPSTQGYSGYYEHGSGRLVVVYNDDSNQLASTIAHEYRHYIQYHRVGPKPLGGVLGLFDKHSYNKAIRLYFRLMWWELDALLFQHKYAPSHISRFWLNGLVLPTNFDEHLVM